MDVLQLDVSGRPQDWMTVKEAAVLYACDCVAWTLGNPRHVLRGGIQRPRHRVAGVQDGGLLDRHPVLRPARDVQLQHIHCVDSSFKGEA